MRRRLATILTAFACGLALAGCSRSDTNSNSGGIGAGAGGAVVGGGGAESADALVKALNAFTDEMLGKVEKAEETKAGVAEAQALLDARKGELAGRLAAVRRGAQAAGSKGSLLEAETDNSVRVHRLQLTYADAAAADAELKAGLERLIDDYDALLR
jgi:hypothetical protein